MALRDELIRQQRDGASTGTMVDAAALTLCGLCVRERMTDDDIEAAFYFALGITRAAEAQLRGHDGAAE